MQVTCYSPRLRPRAAARWLASAPPAIIEICVAELAEVDDDDPSPRIRLLVHPHVYYIVHHHSTSISVFYVKQFDVGGRRWSTSDSGQFGARVGASARNTGVSFDPVHCFVIGEKTLRRFTLVARPMRRSRR